MLSPRPFKPKKCRCCGYPFQPERPFQKVCSGTCAILMIAEEKEKKAAKTAKEARKTLREARERIKTRGEHLRELQDIVNQFVRLRDRDDGCISCDKPATWRGQWHASHFKSVGSNPGLRFNLLNINKACWICNKHYSGNYAGYKPRLEAKIGVEQVAWLEGPAGNEPLKMTLPEILEMKAFYRAEVRRLRKEAA